MELNLPLALELRYRLRPGPSNWFADEHETNDGVPSLQMGKVNDMHVMFADIVLGEVIANFSRVATHKNYVSLGRPEATRWSVRMKPTQQETVPSERH